MNHPQRVVRCFEQEKSKMSKVEFVIEAEARSDVGKGASRRLRRAGKIPAVLYGAGEQPMSLTTDHDSLMHQLEHEAFFSHILTLKVDGKEYQAVLKDLQRHPAKPLVMHADFLRVSEKDKLRMHVPLHFVNDDVAPGAKKGGVVNHVMNEVEVVCLAKDLPEFIEADLANVDLGESVHLSDLKLPAGVELVELLHGEEHDLPVATIVGTRASTEAEGEAAEGEGE
jgi:large subunit ribosomal protein L25